MSVVSPILRGTVLPWKGICVCRGGCDCWVNQEFVLRYQRDGGEEIKKSEWTDRKADSARSDGHHSLITLHKLNRKVLESLADKRACLRAAGWISHCSSSGRLESQSAPREKLERAEGSSLPHGTPLYPPGQPGGQPRNSLPGTSAPLYPPGQAPGPPHISLPPGTASWAPLNPTTPQDSLGGTPAPPRTASRSPPASLYPPG